MNNTMTDEGFLERRRHESLDRAALQSQQLATFNDLLETILPANGFYKKKLAEFTRPIQSIEAFRELPFTTKSELQSGGKGYGDDDFGDDDFGDFAANRTYPLDRYSRFHRTSGTHGRPMIVVDTDDDWRKWIEIWQYVLDAAHVTTQDRVLMAFSFGPFIGFWSANDALVARGAMVIPAGGLSTVSRLRLIEDSGATVICCTPTYALRMAEVAQEHDIEIAKSTVSRIIVAGEPGGSIPSIRKRIENAWDARVVDHSGATEIGPWGYADSEDTGLHIAESDFLPEFLAIESGAPAEDGELSELVLTSLNRIGCPVIRYRTGDLVKPDRSGRDGNNFAFLPGGVLSRADDMLVIRGVNIFPSAVEQILWDFDEVQEYRIIASKNGEMDALIVEVEDEKNAPERIANELNLRLGLKIEVRSVAHRSLPRFEGKGKRFVDERRKG